MRFCVHEARRPGWPRALVISLLMLAALIATPAEASAQGFLDKLFGGWGGSSAPPPPQIQLPPPTSRPVYGNPNPTPNPWLHRPDADDAPRKGGTYRTLCVRMCDGYYWPISHAVTRGRIHKDASACRASCGQDAQLFFHPTNGDQSEMVDVTGRAYVRLPNAFKYRKTLVEGCKCRPEPWAVSEVERHQGYAAAEAEQAHKQMAAKDGTGANATSVVAAAGPAPSAGKSAGPGEAPAEPAPAAPAPDAAVDGTANPKTATAAPVPRPRPVKTDARPRPIPVPPAHQPTVSAYQAPSNGGFGWPFGAGAKGLKWPGD